jgi:hypothetical protein
MMLLLAEAKMKRFGRNLGIALFGISLVTGCTSSSSSASSTSSDDDDKTATNCTEPENPYDEGTGHYAGFEWAEEHNPASCGGSSQSFIEGCEEYQEQESTYETCEAKKK